MLRKDPDKKQTPDIMDCEGSSAMDSENAVITSVEQTELDVLHDETPDSVSKCIHVALIKSDPVSTASASVAPLPKKQKIVLECTPQGSTKDKTLRTNICEASQISVKPKVKDENITTAKITQVKSIANTELTLESKPSSSSEPSRDHTVSSLKNDDPIVQKAYSLAKFIIHNVTHEEKLKPSCKVEETLLRNVTYLMVKHEITFRAIMRRLDINKDTGYLTFVSVANELFENQKRSITWSRILVLYAFGAQLALHCKDKGFAKYASNVSFFMGKYAAEVAGPFVKEQGGWVSAIFRSKGYFKYP